MQTSEPIMLDCARRQSTRTEYNAGPLSLLNSTKSIGAGASRRHVPMVHRGGGARFQRVAARVEYPSPGSTDGVDDGELAMGAMRTVRRGLHVSPRSLARPITAPPSLSLAARARMGRWSLDDFVARATAEATGVLAPCTMQ